MENDNQTEVKSTLVAENSERQPGSIYPSLNEPSGNSNPIVGAVSAVNIQKLNGSNFLPWQRQITIVLKLRGLHEAIKKENVDERLDMQATLILLESMDEAHKIQVQSEPTAMQIMKSLERQYANASENNLHRLLTTYFNCKKDPNHNINQHVGKLKELRARLANLGETQSENMFQVNLIQSLPPEFGDISSTWNSTPPALKNTDLLLNILGEKEIQLKQNRPDETAFLMKTRRMTAREIEDRKKQTHCGKCGQKGHWWRECKNPPKNDNQRDRPNFVANVGEFGIDLKDKWLADTGATSHMCNNKEWFFELTQFDHFEEVKVGDGFSVKVVGKGTVKVITDLDGKKGEGIFTGVLFVPDLATNLISIGACAEKGIETVFSEGRCFLRKEGVNVVMGTNVAGRLYQLQMVPVMKKNTAFLIKDARTKLEWHRALGHPGERRLDTLLSDDKLGLRLKRERECEFCSDCPMGSATRASHPLREELEEAPGKVHIDLSGKINKASLDGYFYYLICKDEATEYCHIYFLKDKSETTKALAELIASFEVESGQRIRQILSDNGSEFKNEKNSLLFLKEHITHQTSAPRTPQQNGRIEREIGSMTSMARTLLTTAGLPLELWAEAMRTACYLRNRLPTKRSALTPFERYFGKKPFLSHVVDFGSEVHAVVNWSYLHKFDARTTPGFLVGYTARSNTYRVYLPSLAKVIQTSDLYFRKHSNAQTRESRQDTISTDNYTTISPESTRDLSEPDSAYEGDKSINHFDTGMPGDSVLSNQTIQGNFTQDVEGQRKEKLLTQFFDEFRRGEFEGQENSECIEDVRETPSQGSTTPGPSVVGLTSSAKRNSEECEKCLNLSKSSVQRELFPSAHGSQSRAQTQQMFAEPLHPLPSDPLQQAEQVEGSQSNEKNPFQGRSIERSPTKMLLRAADMIRRPARFAGVAVSTNENDCPQSVKDAKVGPDSHSWNAAIEEELDAHRVNQTWDVAERPASGCTLTAKWVFTKKRDSQGNVERFKARLVARGYTQREGIDFSETFAPVARPESIRTLLALCAKKNLAMTQFDVSSAFLHGKVEETLFMEAPDGVNIDENKCLKLNKSLYGLRQAPRCWHSRFEEVVRRINFEPTVSDPCVYVTENKETYLAVYVDDGLIISKDGEMCKKILETLNEHFTTKTITGGNFLGMHIDKGEKCISLNQKRYINDLVEKYRLRDSNEISTPLADVKSLFTEDSPSFDGQYREIIGSLLYCATHTRPDILFATILLARFTTKPRKIHMTAAKRIIRYLNSSSNLGLIFERNTGDEVNINAYSDADWAGDPEDSRSTSGVIILISGSPIVFLSKKQTITALSSTEAEYIAACEAAKTLEWLSSFLDELGVTVNRTKLFVDNQSTIRQIKNNQISTKSKHIKLRFHFIRQLYMEKVFELTTIRSDKQLADFLTKNLSGPKLKELITSSGVGDPSDMVVNDMREMRKIEEPSDVVTDEMREMRKMKGKGAQKRGGQVFNAWNFHHLALIILMMHAMCGMMQGVKLTKGPMAIWLPTEYYAETGSIDVELDLVYMNVCESIVSRDDSSNQQSISKKTFEKLKEECMAVHNQQIKPLLEELNTCLPQENERFKRIIWFIPALIVLAIIAVVAAVAVTTVYTIKAHERIDNVETRQTALSDHVYSMKTLTSQINNSTAIALDALAHKIEKNRQLIDELTHVTPSLSWNSAKIYYKQREDINNLKALIKSCKKRKVAIQNLGELIDLTRFKEYEEADTLLTNSKTAKALVEGEHIHRLSFLATKKANDVKIYRIKGFLHYKGLKNEPYVVNYAGPPMVMYNSTNNCTVGVEEIELDHNKVYKSCPLKNFHDPKLNRWINVTNRPDEVMKPQITTVNGDSIIYCTYHNISINNETVPCPPYPIKIEKTITFTVGSYHHKAERVYLKGSTVHEVVQAPKYRSIEVDQDYLEQMSLINEMRRKNVELKELKELNQVGKEGWQIQLSDLFQSSSWHIYVSIASMIITLTSICCTVMLCMKGAGGQVTIVEPPTQQPLPEIKIYPSVPTEKAYLCEQHGPTGKPIKSEAKYQPSDD